MADSQPSEDDVFHDAPEVPDQSIEPSQPSQSIEPSQSRQQIIYDRTNMLRERTEDEKKILNSYDELNQK